MDHIPPARAAGWHRTPSVDERTADALVEIPESGIAVVQPGNSLWRIARGTYGSGLQYTVIYEANKDQIRDPDLIYPGQIFTLPKERR